jgi:hypothetical protein
MGTYRITDKLSAGAYYSNDYSFDTNPQSAGPSQLLQGPAVNTRVDLNRFFYVKLEGHSLLAMQTVYTPFTIPTVFRRTHDWP